MEGRKNLPLIYRHNLPFAPALLLFMGIIAANTEGGWFGRFFRAGGKSGHWRLIIQTPTRKRMKRKTFSSRVIRVLI